MGANTICPVCDEPFDSRIPLGSIQRMKIDKNAEMCIAPRYERICIHYTG